MNGIDNRNGAIDFSAYVTFADAQIQAGAKKAIVRLGGGEGGRRIVPCTDGDYVGRVGSLRGDERAGANNAVRDNFLKAVLARCGKTNVADLPDSVKKVLLLKDFKLDGNGNASSGKPLTARRIKAIDAAINAEEIEAVKLKAYNDPLSSVPMLQTNGGTATGTALCYVNSLINGLKFAAGGKGKKYLASLFTAKGCTLFAEQRDPQTDKRVLTPTRYEYASEYDYSPFNQVNDYSSLERVMLSHKVHQQHDRSAGGYPTYGAQMLGLKRRDARKAWPPPAAGKALDLVACIKNNLKDGCAVVIDMGRHFEAIVGVVERGGKQYIKLVDDLNVCRVGNDESTRSQTHLYPVDLLRGSFSRISVFEVPDV